MSDMSMWYAAHRASHFEPWFLAECPFCHDPTGAASRWLEARQAQIDANRRRMDLAGEPYHFHYDGTPEVPHE